MGKKSSRQGGIIPIADEDRRTLIAVAVSFPVALIIAIVVIADACTR